MLTGGDRLSTRENQELTVLHRYKELEARMRRERECDLKLLRAEFACEISRARREATFVGMLAVQVLVTIALWIAILS